MVKRKDIGSVRKLIMTPRPFCFALLFLVTQIAWTQTMIPFQDAVLYDEQRYAGIKASPYFFDTFVKGWIFNEEGVRFAPVSMNYNGYTRAFEVRQGDRFISLSSKYYPKVELLVDSKADTITFIRNVHPEFKEAFVQLVYESDRHVLVKTFEVGLNESVKNLPGKTMVTKRFSPRLDWYLITKENQRSQKLTNNKRKILKDLYRGKELSDFLKNNKTIDLNTDKGMKFLIQEWEQRVF